MEKKLWNIYEESDVDGGFGDAVWAQNLVGTVMATDEEIKEFLEYWDKPRVYDHPYADLMEHHIVAEEVHTVDIHGFEPYNPKTRLWPDLPGDAYSFYEWDGEKWIDPHEKED